MDRLNSPSSIRETPSQKRTVVFVVILVGAVLALPRVAPSPMLLHVLIMISLAIAQGSAWNILGGYAGQHSIGHAAYFGIGAYTTLMAIEYWNRSLVFGMVAAALNAVTLAIVVGTVTFRLRGPYFVLASISVAEMIRLLAIEAKGLTRGAEGILLSRVPRLGLAGIGVSSADKVPYYYASVGLALWAVAVSVTVHHSKLGYYFRAVREDQDAAHSLGVNLLLYKNIALGISAVLTAWAGALWGLYVKFLDPNLAFGIDVSVQMLLVAVIGGTGTVSGPVYGAVVLVSLSETLRNPKWLVAINLVSDDSAFVAFVQRRLTSAHVLFYGLLLVVVVLFAPTGVVGQLKRLRDAIDRKGAALVRGSR